MKRKAARKIKPARAAKRIAKKPPGIMAAAANAPAKKPAQEPARDAVDALVAASARALRLTLDPAWQANVKFNLELILRHSALVDEFPLPDDAEPAPVFHA
jgi:hypothetical protein